MRNIFFEGIKIGAAIGFTTAIFYAIIVLIVFESQLPIPDPSIEVIFTADFFDFEFPALLTASPIWLLTPTIIGSVTAGCLAFIISKFQPNRKSMFFLSILLSTIIALPLLILYRFMVINITSGEVFHSILEPIFEIRILLLIPSVIYILVTIITGQYLHTRLRIKPHDRIIFP